MQKWEYIILGASFANNEWRAKFQNGKVIDHWEAKTLAEHIASLGEQGWELVSVTFTTQTTRDEGGASYRKYEYSEWYRMFFKRPKD